MIEVKNLVKKYGNHVAVNDLSFTVEDGRIYGFLGPNGAGKSTTMNIITGYIASTEGEVLINGHNILEEPEEAKKCIGYLPEQPPLYFDMTVYEYLKFVAELKKIPKEEREKQIEDVIKLTNLESMKGRLIKNLSKGYKQRTGLAQAILGYPEVIILDEPTVGLDPKQIIEIRDLIKSLGKKHTVILSSHIMQEISAVCDDVMIISHGKLVACDTTDNLSKMTMGSNELELTIKGKKEEINKIISAIPEIEEFSIAPSKEDSGMDVSVKTAETTDLREMLFYRMAEAKCPIIKMEYNKLSLEDIFLELTENENQDKENTKEEKPKASKFFATADEALKSLKEEADETKSEVKEETNHAGDL